MRRHVRFVVFSVGIGMAIGAVYGLGRPPEELVASIVIGALCGVMIYASSELLLLAFAPLIERLPPRARHAATGLLYGLAGAVGWYLGVIIGNTLYGQPVNTAVLVSSTGRAFMVITAAIALAASIVFKTMTAMEARLAKTLLAEKELEVARAIQSQLLPPAYVTGAGFAVSARNVAAQYVAGDLYDVLPLPGGMVAVVVADVAGKGVGASLIMASVKAMLPFVAPMPVAEAMATLNARLCETLRKREFVAMAFARFDPASGALELVNGGMPDPYVAGAGGVRALATSGERLPLGIRRGVTYGTLATTIAPDEKVLFVSDGLPEAPAVNGAPLGYDAMTTIVESMNGTQQRGEAWLDELLARVRARVDATLADDWTAVLLERA